MSSRTVSLEELRDQPLGEFFREVARRQEVLTVVLGEGEAVEIRPAGVLEPLPELEGRVPPGWKDAIYGR